MRESTFGHEVLGGEADPAACVTDEDVAFYRRHGWWISPPIVPPSVLDAAERGMARFYAGEIDHELALRDGRPFRPGWKPGDPEDVLRKNDDASLMVDELAVLVHTPAIAAVAARLSGAAGIRLWHDQLLFKPVDAPGVAGNVGWHTDRQYWQTCTSEEMLTAWVPFHDVDETTGAVTFLDGSHLLDLPRGDFFGQDLDALRDALGPAAAGLEARTVVMRRGQVSFHHCRTVHGSGPNRSAHPRRVLAIHLQPSDNRYRDAVGPDGAPLHHTNDALVRLVDGVPDYADPAWCPELWPLHTEPVA